MYNIAEIEEVKGNPEQVNPESVKGYHKRRNLIKNQLKKMTDINNKIIVTGAAGLVGQNLIVQLEERGYNNIVAIDKNKYNLDILHKIHPDVTTILADLSDTGDWVNSFKGAACLILLHAQITGKTNELFIRNNINATRIVLDAAGKHQIPYIVHVSSSVVISLSDDDYTTTKRIQEQLVVESGIPCCVLRPTLMFGWFDPKHLGWLSRFMERIPVFPIPGHGRYMRQPLYNKDFCNIIIHCLERQPKGETYNVVGDTRIEYIDIIRTIKQVKGLQTIILKIPYSFFNMLLRIYALFSRYPPFTAGQLKALTAGDDFSGVNTEKMFGIKQTPFEEAMYETFCDDRYCKVVLERTGIGM